MRRPLTLTVFSPRVTGIQRNEQILVQTVPIVFPMTVPQTNADCDLLLGLLLP